MKILVLSDSHGMIDNCKKVLKRINNKIDGVIHLGDIVSDVEILKILYPNIKFYNVSGNCDFCTDVPQEQVINIGEKNIFITHGHKYNVKYGTTFGYDRILYASEEKGADICLFGHTHMPVISTLKKVILMNPGSISQPRGIDVCTYGMIDISDKGLVIPSVVGICKSGFKVISV